MDEDSWVLPNSPYVDLAQDRTTQDDNGHSFYWRQGWAQDLNIDVNSADRSQFSGSFVSTMNPALVASENEILDSVIRGSKAFEEQYRQLLSVPGPWGDSSAEQLPPWAMTHPPQPQPAFDNYFAPPQPQPQPSFTQFDNYYAPQHSPQPQPASTPQFIYNTPQPPPQSYPGSRPSGMSIVRFIPYKNPIYQGEIVNGQMQLNTEQSGVHGAGVINVTFYCY
jgi:hypothetical protein